MPKNLKAEAKLLEKPLDTKVILSSNNRIQKKREIDDDDLKNAIRMSLLENDMDLDRFAGTSGIQYPSLAVDMQHSQDDDLKRAIELSLATQQPDKVEEKLTPEKMREKRLKRFDNLSKPDENKEEEETSLKTEEPPSEKNSD